MPDITMCMGDGCPAKERCYRFTAKPSKYQSYFAVVPWQVETYHCAHFVEVTPAERGENGSEP